MSLLLALTARLLRCRDFVRLQCYFRRSYEPVDLPARDPLRSLPINCSDNRG
jgi:hypothetical protein